MLTILDTLNHFLGYFNINSKPRSRIYTVIAAIGNFYLLYLAIHAFRYSYILRGIIYALIFLILLYFVILNIVFYFTDKTVKFDISPKVEKLLGGPPKDALAKANQTQATPAVKNIPTAGLFNENNLVPATIEISDDEQQNLTMVVSELGQKELILSGFDKLSETEIQKRLKHNKTVHKIEKPIDMPYFDLQQQGQDMIILGGLNALSARPIGHLAHVGLSNVADAVQDYNLALAHLKVSGGPQKVLNADAITEVPTPYLLQAKVAFKQKQRAANSQ